MKYSNRKQRNTGQPAQVPDSSGSMTFDKALEIYLNAYEASVLLGFWAYISKVHQHEMVDRVTESDIVGWMVYLRTATSKRGRPYTTATIQSKVRDVIVFYNWLFSHKKIAVNPVADLREPKADKVLIRVYTEEDLIKLDAACERSLHGPSLTEDERKALAARDRAVLWLLLSTGIRAGELCGLRFSDLDWDESLIYVRGKDARERRVPFGKVARQHLDTYIQYWRGVPADSDEFVFITTFGTKMRSTNTIQLIFSRLHRVSGIKISAFRRILVVTGLL